MEIETEVFVFVLIFLIVIGVFYFFVIRDEKPDNVAAPEKNFSSDNLSIVSKNETINQTTEEIIGLNVGAPRWEKIPITYRFVNDFRECEGFPVKEMLRAMEEVEKASKGLVKFRQAMEHEIANINLTCVNKEALLAMIINNEKCKDFILDKNSAQISGQELLEEEDYLTSFTIVQTNQTTKTYKICYIKKSDAPGFDWTLLEEARAVIKDKKIVSGYKNIYTANSKHTYCMNFPAKEVHEIMHLMGFTHIETPYFDKYYGWSHGNFDFLRDLMFAYPSCSQINQFGEKYSKCLEYIYSNGEVNRNCEGIKF